MKLSMTFPCLKTFYPEDEIHLCPKTSKSWSLLNSLFFFIPDPQQGLKVTCCLLSHTELQMMPKLFCGCPRMGQIPFRLSQHPIMPLMQHFLPYPAVACMDRHYVSVSVTRILCLEGSARAMWHTEDTQ